MKDLKELTTHCIRCGFCLESCPTFVTSGSELESPRGRIYLVRSALDGKIDWQEGVRPHLDLCLGCRACETACPSAVEYGSILEMARDLVEQKKPQFTKLMLLNSTTNTKTLRAQLGIGSLLPGKKLPSFISKALSGADAEAEKPKPQKSGTLPPLLLNDLPPVIGHVYLLEGCAMRVLYPRVHEATRRLLRRIGYEVVETEQGCCGALHAHYGYVDNAREMATELLLSMSSEIPIVVNSAGCASTMKGYDHLLEQTAGGSKMARRTFDASEFLFNNGLADVLKGAKGFDARVTYHDACHLAHGQKITNQPRSLLEAIPKMTLVPLPEADMCCGSAGIYNVIQPKMARTLLDRKYDNIASTMAHIVATGNPGCHSWIAQAARERGNVVRIMHTMEVLEAAFIGLPAFAD